MTYSTKYQCSRCYRKYDHEESALECCPPEIYEIYICDTCGEEHEESDEAELCCSDEDNEEDADRDSRSYPKNLVNTAHYVEEFCRMNWYVKD